MHIEKFINCTEKEKNMERTWKLAVGKYWQYLFVLLGATILFLINIFLIQPVELDNWDVWCSGSTIKFVNNWLQEGALRLKFLMVENPASIEFVDLAARVPYVSYPSLSCIVPYVIAKLCGMSQIDMVFIREIAIGMFGLDTILVSLISFVICKHCINVKNDALLICGAIGMGFWWSMLPASQYYMKNFLFADEVVLFWLYIMVLFELYREINPEIHILKRKKYFFYMARFIIILLGMWTDYYFWIFMFVACVLRFILNAGEKTIKKNILELLKSYVIPVIFSVSMFAAQVFSVPGGWDSLVYKFVSRTSSVYEGHSMYRYIYNQIKNTLGMGGIAVVVSFVLVTIYILYWFFRAFKRGQKRNGDTFLFWAVGLLMLPPVLQIFILKNHSGIHGFSMVKLGIPCVFGILFMVLILSQMSKQVLKKAVYPISLLLFLAIGGSLCGESAYYAKNETPNNLTDKENDFTYVVNQYFKGYEMVLFSNTIQVVENPPMLLAKTGKRIYLANRYSDVLEMFPNLNQNARKIYIIERDSREDVMDSNISQQLNDENMVFVSAFYEFYELKM